MALQRDGVVFDPVPTRTFRFVADGSVQEEQDRVVVAPLESGLVARGTWDRRRENMQRFVQAARKVGLEEWSGPGLVAR